MQDLAIDLPNATVAAVSLFLDFIYGTNNFSLDGVDSKDRDHLLALATKFGILDLIHAVRQFVTPTKMEKLPDEIQVEIISYLNLPERLNMR